MRTSNIAKEKRLALRDQEHLLIDLRYKCKNYQSFLNLKLLILLPVLPVPQHVTYLLGFSST